MADENEEMNAVLDFITAFQGAGRQVCTQLRSAYGNLQFNSLPPRATQAQKTKAARFATVASETLLKSVERQIAGYMSRTTGRDLYMKEGHDPDGRKVLLNMLERDGIDILQGQPANTRNRLIRDEMHRNGIEKPTSRDVVLYDTYRTAIASTAMHIIQSMKGPA